MAVVIKSKSEEFCHLLFHCLRTSRHESGIQIWILNTELSPPWTMKLVLGQFTLYVEEESEWPPLMQRTKKTTKASSALWLKYRSNLCPNDDGLFGESWIFNGRVLLHFLKTAFCKRISTFLCSKLKNWLVWILDAICVFCI